MSSVDVLSRIGLSVATVLVPVYIISCGYSILRKFSRWILLISALLSTLSLVLQIISSRGVLYGRWDRATAIVGIGLIWCLFLWPSDSRRPLVAGGSLAALFLACSWLTTTPDEPLLFTGSWFWIAQAFTAFGASLWLYAGCHLFAPGESASKPSLNWALISQVAGIIGLGIGAQRAWGWAWSWDPVECWWLFAITMSALSLWGRYQRRWHYSWVVLLGLVPALTGWFGSWFIIQALNLASRYMTGV
jgi:hypothetical protein